MICDYVDRYRRRSLHSHHGSLAADTRSTEREHATSLTPQQARRRAAPTALDDDPLWWRSAVIYQVYVRSFADGDGDGTGDLAGVRSRLRLPQGPRRRRASGSTRGTRARWPTAATTSPTTATSTPVRHARRSGGRSSPRRSRSASARSSTSSRTTSATSTRGSRRRSPPAPAAPSASASGSTPARATTATRCPTHWVSSFQGDTWTRTTNPDGTPGEWYLHLFTPEQPDLNWNHPDVRREHEDILRFWFDRGVAGVRIDSAALLIKDPDAARGRPRSRARRAPDRGPRRAARRVPRVAGASPTPTRARACSSARSGCPTSTASPPTCGPTRCTRRSTSTSWRGRGTRRAFATRSTRRSPRTRPSARRARGCSPTTTSPGRSPATAGRTRASRSLKKRFGTPTDPSSARAAPAPPRCWSPPCPGRLYIYQGDELGLPEVEDLPLELIEDPMHFRSGGIDPGRDGCRVPLPWRGDAAPVRLQPCRTATTARRDPGCRSPPTGPRSPSQAQEADPGSMLCLYRAGAAHPQARARPRRRPARRGSTSAPRRARLPARRRLRVRHQPRRRPGGAARPPEHPALEHTARGGLLPPATPRPGSHRSDLTVEAAAAPHRGTYPHHTRHTAPERKGR